MFYLVFTAMAMVATILHVAIAQTPVIETLLMYILFFNVGFSGLFAFMGHAFKADEIAKFIGWKPGSHFQFEIAIANLSYGVMGVLSIWLREGFWMAVIVGNSVFSWGAAYGHIKDIVKNKNFAPGNAGPPLYVDIIKPAILIGLLIAFLLGY